MILIYAHTTSARLQYTCNFIFKELMGADFLITIDSEAFKDHEGVCINYSSSAIRDKEFRMGNHSLLFEGDIKEQRVSCINTNGHKAFFSIPDAGYSFDIFAATFYLLSRYEEYLPHTKD